MSRRNRAGGCALGVGNQVGWSVKQPCLKARRFKMMLDQPRDVGVVFQYKNGLAQTIIPRRRPLELQDA